MDAEAAPQIVWAAVVTIFLIIVFASARWKRGRQRSLNVGAGTSGAIYDFLNQDKRKAIEIIVEEKAAADDPETADDIVEPHESGGVRRDAHH
jgi:hypothetical protein